MRGTVSFDWAGISEGQRVHPGEVLMAPRQESHPLLSSLIFPLPRSFSRTLLEEWHSQLLPWLGEDREALNAAQGNTAGSQRCPLQHALPFDSWCCCIFCPAFSSTSRTEPAKMDYRGPRKFTQDQQGQNSLTSSPLTVPVSILFSCLEK